MASYKKRLMEQRSRRIQRDIASREIEEDARESALVEIKAPVIVSKPEPPAKNTPTLDMLLQEPSQEEANLEICGSGVNSFDSSVNWDALAYSMSGSLSVANEVSSQQIGFAPEATSHGQDGRNQFQPSDNTIPEHEPVSVPSPQKHYPVLARIEQIKRQHDEKMAKIRVEIPVAVEQSETSQIEFAPDDEFNDPVTNSPSEEENRPLSPNSINDYLSPKSTKTSMSEAVQKHIDAMKHELEKEMFQEQHIEEGFEPRKFSSSKSPASQHSKRFNFDATSRSKKSTKDLMLKNMELEQEMEQIRALSPRSPDSWSSPRSPLSRKALDQQDVSSPVRSPMNRAHSRNIIYGSAGSPRSRDQKSLPESKCILNVEIPTSPISSPRRLTRTHNSPMPMMARSKISPRNERVTGTRVSDLLQEVKGFLAENDRARERIARDMDAMQAMHNC
jgi:hypothetical protein